MKITIKTLRFNASHGETCLAQLAEDKLDGSDYDRGQLETAARTAANNSRAIGKLLEKLLEGGVLTVEQVRDIIPGDYEITVTN